MFIFHTGTFTPTAAIATAWLKDLFVADDWVNLEIDNLIPVVRHSRPSAPVFSCTRHWSAPRVPVMSPAWKMSENYRGCNEDDISTGIPRSGRHRHQQPASLATETVFPLLFSVGKCLIQNILIRVPQFWHWYYIIFIQRIREAA